MPIETTDPDAVQTVLVHEADEGQTTPSVEQFRSLAASAFSTWRESPSGRQARSRLGTVATPVRVPQFDEDEEGEGDDESQSTPDEAAAMELTAYIYATMLGLKLEDEQDAGRAIDTIREFLQHTLGPFFGEDEELVSSLTEDDHAFARIPTGEWGKNREEIISDFIKSLVPHLVAAELKIGHGDVVQKILGTMSATERKPLYKYLGRQEDKTAFRRLAKIRAKQTAAALVEAEEAAKTQPAWFRGMFAPDDPDPDPSAAMFVGPEPTAQPKAPKPKPAPKPALKPAASPHLQSQAEAWFDMMVPQIINASDKRGTLGSLLKYRARERGIKPGTVRKQVHKLFFEKMSAEGWTGRDLVAFKDGVYMPLGKIFAETYTERRKQIFLKEIYELEAKKQAPKPAAKVVVRGKRKRVKFTGPERPLKAAFIRGRKLSGRQKLEGAFNNAKDINDLYNVFVKNKGKAKAAGISSAPLFINKLNMFYDKNIVGAGFLSQAGLADELKLSAFSDDFDDKVTDQWVSFYYEYWKNFTGRGFYEPPTEGKKFDRAVQQVFLRHNFEARKTKQFYKLWQAAYTGPESQRLRANYKDLYAHFDNLIRRAKPLPPDSPEGAFAKIRPRAPAPPSPQEEKKAEPSPPTTPRKGPTTLHGVPASPQDTDVTSLSALLKRSFTPKVVDAGRSPPRATLAKVLERQSPSSSESDFYDPTVQPTGYEGAMTQFKSFQSQQSPQFLRSFTSPALTHRTDFSSPMTMFSMRVRVRRPLDRAHIVKLQTILEKTRTDRPLHDEMSMQAYGFNYNAWLRAQQQKFPIESMTGKKQTFGNITTNRRSGMFTFKIVKRTTDKMRKALYNYIEQMFDLGVAKIEIKRKDFQEVSGVSSTKDLDEYITAQMRGKRQLIFRISW